MINQQVPGAKGPNVGDFDLAWCLTAALVPLAARMENPADRERQPDMARSVRRCRACGRIRVVNVAANLYR